MSVAPKVWNLQAGGGPLNAVFIGRPSAYANPFVVGRDGDRAYCCEAFEKFVLPEMDVSYLRGKDLICFCAPRGGTTGEEYGGNSRFRCHGYSILKKANQ